MKKSEKMKEGCKEEGNEQKLGQILGLARCQVWVGGWGVTQGEAKKGGGVVCAHLRRTFVLDLSCLLHYSLAVRGSYSGSKPFRRY